MQRSSNATNCFWFFAFQEPSAGVGYMQRSIELEPIEHIFGDFPRLTFPYPEERESSEPPRSHYGRQGGKQEQERFEKKPLISCRRLSQSSLFRRGMNAVSRGRTVIASAAKQFPVPLNAEETGDCFPTKRGNSLLAMTHAAASRRVTEALPGEMTKPVPWLRANAYGYRHGAKHKLTALSGRLGRLTCRSCGLH